VRNQIDFAQENAELRGGRFEIEVKSLRRIERSHTLTESPEKKGKRDL